MKGLQNIKEIRRSALISKKRKTISSLLYRLTINIINNLAVKITWQPVIAVSSWIIGSILNLSPTFALLLLLNVMHSCKYGRKSIISVSNWLDNPAIYRFYISFQISFEFFRFGWHNRVDLWI